MKTALAHTMGSEDVGEQGRMRMAVESLAPQAAFRLEQGEVEAWIDLYEAAPADFASRFGLELVRNGGIAATLCKSIPFIHFNSVMNFGMGSPATERQLDQLLEAYRDAGIARPWFYHIPQGRPDALPRWFRSRGLEQHGGWERIFREGTGVPQPVPTNDLSVERVSRATAAEWAGFIDKTYGLPTTPWLLALVDRQGWSHYVARRAGTIVAVRSMFVSRGGIAWMGIEAPVPGIMAPSFDIDVVICDAMVRDAITGGATTIVADIEAPSANGDGPAYRNFARLGFRKAYFRAHYSYAVAESG